MKLPVLILLFLLLGATCTAQETCVLKSKENYAVTSLRLGMSPAEASAALRNMLKIKIKKDGEQTFFQNFVNKKPPRVLLGVRALYLRFFNRRLYQIEAFYEIEPGGAQTIAEYARYLIAAFELPENAFQIKNGIAEIKCSEISLIADYVLNPRVEFTDETVRAQVETNRKKNDRL